MHSETTLVDSVIKPQPYSIKPARFAPHITVNRHKHRATIHKPRSVTTTNIHREQEGHLQESKTVRYYYSRTPPTPTILFLCAACPTSSIQISEFIHCHTNFQFWHSRPRDSRQFLLYFLSDITVEGGWGGRSQKHTKRRGLWVRGSVVLWQKDSMK
jgi:hypothetical protein